MSKWILVSVFLVAIFYFSRLFFVRTAHADEPVGNPVVVLETNQGSIELELWPDISPKTCENMIGLVQKGYYDGTVFHRVIKGFMVQGGDPTATGRGGESLWGGRFEDEISKTARFDKAGLLAMANAGPNTNGSQFFITTVEHPGLTGVIPFLVRSSAVMMWYKK